MPARKEPSQGPYKYRPSDHRHVVSTDGRSVCTVHRGPHGAANGKLLAASWQMLEALEAAAQVMPLGEEYEIVTEAIASAKGERG